MSVKYGVGFNYIFLILKSFILVLEVCFKTMLKDIFFVKFMNERMTDFSGLCEHIYM